MKTLLVRAEDKNIWERRCTIVPSDLEKILDETGAQAFIEKSGKRYFKEKAYTAAGAVPCEGMQDGEVILGVKEIPGHKVLDNKIYMFFSHTVKGQAENMPLLKKIMESGSTLIDYEKIVDQDGRRKVYFGPYAGDAGAIDLLWLMGEYWQHKGISTPLIECKQANNYDSLEDARNQLQSIGAAIREQGFHESIPPIIVGILGYGNVSKGAQQIFECLPVKRLQPSDLEDLGKTEPLKNNTIYMVVFKEEHLVERMDGKSFGLQDYYENPGQYRSCFNRYLPYITWLVNATYWEDRYPRFVTWDDLDELFQQNERPRICGIADITCDVGGSIECNVKTTDTGMPAYRVHQKTRTISDGHKGEGIVLLAVDNLPAELPKDASEFFSRQLQPYVPGILKADFSKPLDQAGLDPDIQRAVIVYNGNLTASFKYLEKFIAK